MGKDGVQLFRPHLHQSILDCYHEKTWLLWPKCWNLERAHGGGCCRSCFHGWRWGGGFKWSTLLGGCAGHCGRLALPTQVWWVLPKLQQHPEEEDSKKSPSWNLSFMSGGPATIPVWTTGNETAFVEIYNVCGRSVCLAQPFGHEPFAWAWQRSIPLVLWLVPYYAPWSSEKFHRFSTCPVVGRRTTIKCGLEIRSLKC